MARFVPLAALALPLVSGARLADLLKTAATGTAPPPPAVDSDDLPQCKLPSTLPKFTELKSPYAAALHPNGGLLELVCTGGREPAASKDGYPAEIVMECKDGYFQEKEHVACVFASPCGKPVANANHASYSGIEDKEKGYLYRCTLCVFGRGVMWEVSVVKKKMVTGVLITTVFEDASVSSTRERF